MIGARWTLVNVTVPLKRGESCNVTCNPGFNVNLSSLASSIEMFQCVLREKGSQTGVI